MGDVEEIDEEVSSEFSAASNICRGSDMEELLFIQPHMHSPEEKQSMRSKYVIPKTWLLLDSQITVDAISNVGLLTKNQQVKTALRIRCNAGTKPINHKGPISGYGFMEWTRSFIGRCLRPSAIDWDRLPISKLPTTLLRRR